MALQSQNKLIEAAHIFAANPVSALAFGFDSLRGIKGAPRQLSFRGIKLWVRPGSPDLKVVRSCLLGEFDEVYRHVPSNHNFIIDVGGYIGLVSILLAREFPDAQIVCLEPSSENYLLAEKNCAPYTNIDVMNVALLPTSDVVKLKDRGTGQWGFTVVEQSHDRADAKTIEEVQGVTIPQLLEQYGKSGIDLLKLDIEGGEYALLKDRPEWVADVGVVVAEIHDRICPGASKAFEDAMGDRREIMIQGEKRVSITARGTDAT